MNTSYVSLIVAGVALGLHVWNAFRSGGSAGPAVPASTPTADAAAQHPLLDVVVPFIESLLPGPNGSSLTAADQSLLQAGAAGLAQLLRLNPQAHAAVSAALGAPLVK